MALVQGTNYGFCLSRPSGDPAGDTVFQWHAKTNVTGTFSAPAGSVTEIGCYYSGKGFGTATVYGTLYTGSPTGNPVSSQTGTLPVGATAGWYYVTLATPFELTTSTSYWIGWSSPSSPSDCYGDSKAGSSNAKYVTSVSPPSPWGASTTENKWYAIYAVYTAPPEPIDVAAGFIDNNQSAQFEPSVLIKSPPKGLWFGADF